MATQWWILSNSQGAQTTYDVVEDYTGTPKPTTRFPNAAIGPFPTKAAAEATIKTGQQNAGKGWTSPGGAVDTGISAIGIPNPLSGLAAIAAALAKFVGYLGDGAMWRSLGWILLGGALFGLGTYLWLKKSDLIPPVVPIPV